MKNARDDRKHPSVSPLFVDLYELTMGAVYHRDHMTDESVFELFFQSLPEGRDYVVACGQERILDYLAAWPFSRDDLDYLRSLEKFDESYLAALGELRFTGDVYAMPEGAVVFPDEPILQVTAPPLQAQILETFALNQVHVHSLLTTKAARVVDAAAGRKVVDFGSRRAHGRDAALAAARATYAAGGSGSSNLEAGRRHGVPVFGTMAHSFISMHTDEAAAFQRFAGVFPGTTLLVDTYDTIAGVETVVRLAGELGDRFRVGGVRLDSGDLGELARASRRILDEGGLDDVNIFASSDLDEHAIADLVASGAPIDGFGVGSNLVQSSDDPGVDLKYKLVAYAGTPRTKTSTGKAYHAGRKQVIRRREDGRFAGDTLVPFDTAPDRGLLRPLVRGGEPVAGARTSLEETRERVRAELEALPEAIRALKPADAPYPVSVSDEVERMTSEA